MPGWRVCVMAGAETIAKALTTLSANRIP